MLGGYPGAAPPPPAGYSPYGQPSVRIIVTYLPKKDLISQQLSTRICHITKARLFISLQINPNVASWFRAVDQDNSGQITASELKRALVNGNWSNFSEEACKLMIGEKVKSSCFFLFEILYLDSSQSLTSSFDQEIRYLTTLYHMNNYE